jgi:hypothetical protein
LKLPPAPKYKYAKKTCSLDTAGEGKKRGEKRTKYAKIKYVAIVVWNGSPHAPAHQPINHHAYAS